MCHLVRTDGTFKYLKVKTDFNDSFNRLSVIVVKF